MTNLAPLSGDSVSRTGTTNPPTGVWTRTRPSWTDSTTPSKTLLPWMKLATKRVRGRSKITSGLPTCSIRAWFMTTTLSPSEKASF